LVRFGAWGQIWHEIRAKVGAHTPKPTCSNLLILKRKSVLRQLTPKPFCRKGCESASGPRLLEAPEQRPSEVIERKRKRKRKRKRERENEKIALFQEHYL
jgi:hypothetical protein